MVQICEDRWLSAIFGHGVFKIEVENTALGQREPHGDPSEMLQRHAREQPAAMYYAKIDTEHVGLVRRLSGAGLYVVEVNVTLGMDARCTSRPALQPALAICEAGPQHGEAVLDIAASCFKYSRFHLDPFIPDTLAHRIKHDWILSYIRGQRGEQLFAALIDERPAGFLAVLAAGVNGTSARVIDLIGVDRAFQHRGVGEGLVAFFIERYRDRCDRLQVGTQVANVPSIRLYEKLGFSVTRSQYVMHMHVRNGAPAF